jgi:citrate lyase subunit beta/citryl-CoA lyase
MILLVPQTSMSDICAPLFCPCTSPRRLRRAIASSASAVIADLEDAVPLAEKDEARRIARQELPFGGDRSVILRINGADTPQFAEDVALAQELPLAGIMLPKATPDGVDRLGVDGPPIWALVETAQGLMQAAETAARPRVEVLMLGTVDLALDLDLRARADGLELLHARSSLVLAARVGGTLAPIDGVCVDVADLETLEREAQTARDLGFGGKACIHPDQLSTVQRAFAVSPQQRAWAARVVDAYEAAAARGDGAVLLDGRLVDQPIVDQARRILLGAPQEEDPR